jgi:hypothetical protein
MTTVISSSVVILLLLILTWSPDNENRNTDEQGFYGTWILKEFM